MSPRPRLLPFALVWGVLCIATAAFFIKKANIEAAASVIAAARLGLATVILIPIALALRGPKVFRMPAATRLKTILAGLFLGAHFYFWITSLSHTSVLSSVVIVTTNPIFVGLASFLFFKEPLKRELIIGVALAAVGGACISLMGEASGGSGQRYGNLMALAGAIMASGYWLTGRSARKEMDNLSYIVPVYAVAALFLIAVATTSGQNVLSYHAETYIYFALLALVPQLMGHSCLNWALGYASATVVVICILGEPLGASLIAYLFLGERVWPGQALGGVLILAGIYVSTREPKPVPTTAAAVDHDIEAGL